MLRVAIADVLIKTAAASGVKRSSTRLSGDESS